MNPAPACSLGRQMPQGTAMAITALVVSLVVFLSGCGGGQGESDVTGASAENPALARAAETPATPGRPATAQDASQLALGAQLSAAELQAAELRAEAADQFPATAANAWLEPGEGVAMPRSAYTSGQVAAKAAAVRIPAYRFYNGGTGAHFYTTNDAERDQVQATLSPPYSYEGAAFSVANAFSPGLAPVHRFYNTQSGVHFYTISEAERANVVANLPQFNYEGVAYHASQVAGAGLTPLYRFFVPSRGFHFYTASAAERNHIQANLNAIYNYEGVGYHVLASDWRAEKLAHTGVTSNQCLEAGSGTLVACGSGGATALNPQQDGHRAALNAMSYTTVGSFATTQCVYDNVTGLFWEGKTATGVRSGSFSFTNLGNGLPGDASRYVQDVNALAPCGISNWRLPTREELFSLVDFGRSTVPRLNTTWFPNTASGLYWSSEAQGSDATRAWFMAFDAAGGYSGTYEKSINLHVRLVSGSMPTISRYSYSTIAYGSDMAGNVVNDAWTGLQWRRCEQGRTWNGSTCTGAASVFNHDQALAHARDQSGWRLPNVKELASISNLGVASGSTITASVFPGGISAFVWSTTPEVGVASFRWGMDFATGETNNAGSGATHGVRLIRGSP